MISAARNTWVLALFYTQGQWFNSVKTSPATDLIQHSYENLQQGALMPLVLVNTNTNLIMQNLVPLMLFAIWLGDYPLQHALCQMPNLQFLFCII